MNSTTLQILSDEFLTNCRVSKSLTENTLHAYRQDLVEFQAFFGPSSEVDTVDGDDLKAYLSRLRIDRNLSAATVRRRIACLKAMFRWAKEEQLIGSSPFDEAGIFVKIPKCLPRTLSRQEVGRLTDDVFRGLWDEGSNTVELQTTSCKLTTYLAVYLMLATGVRVSELLGIRLGDIDPTCSTIRIRGKGARERTVFLANRLLRMQLSKYVFARTRCRPHVDLVFLNTRNQPLTPQALRLRLRKLGSSLAFKQRLTPHRFRHTAATLLIEEGVDIRFVQRLLGHSSISTTEIYTHVADVSLRTALERADTVGKVIEGYA